MSIVTSLAIDAIFLSSEAPAVLGLVLVAQNTDPLRNVQLVVSFAFLLAMGKVAVVAHGTSAELVIRAEDVRLDMDVGLHLSLIVVIAVVSTIVFIVCTRVIHLSIRLG